jgi:hypothetical protein
VSVGQRAQSGARLEISLGSLPESFQGVLQESRGIVGEHLVRTELISVIEYTVTALTETGVCQTSPMGKAYYIDSSDSAAPRAWCLKTSFGHPSETGGNAVERKRTIS